MAQPLAVNRASPSWAERLVRELAVHDWIVLGYHLVVFGLALSGSGPLWQRSVSKSGAILFLTLGGVLLHRSGVLVGERVLTLAYRLVVYGGVQVSYFALRDILPTFAPYTLDDALHRIDLAVLGLEPSVAWQHLATPAAVEYFAFFYFGYYFLLALYVLPIMFGARDPQRMADFALTVILVFCASHLLYFAVPGYGPVKHLASSYDHELSGGLFYRWVIATVSSGGAQKDIFPSLHTGAPVAIACFAFRHRAALPYKWVWLPTALFVANIVGATVFLRWHYVVDVVAGLAVAGLVSFAAPRIAAWEHARRSRSAWLGIWGLFG